MADDSISNIPEDGSDANCDVDESSEEDLDWHLEKPSSVLPAKPESAVIDQPDTPEKIIYNQLKERLVVCLKDNEDESEAIFYKNLKKQNQLEVPSFTLNYYRNSRSSRPPIVVFSVKADNCNYIMYCKENGKVHFKKDDPKEVLPGNEEQYDFVFYEKTSQNSSTFESAFVKGSYLGFEVNSSPKCLVLKTEGNGVDETIKLAITET